MSVRMCGLVMAMLSAGCALSEGSGNEGSGGRSDPPEATVTSATTGDCDAFMCGTNSPQIAEFGFWDLNLPTTFGVPGAANNVGLEVVFFVQGSAFYLPRVVGGRLFAVDPGGGPTLSGAGLVGGFLYLRNGSRQFQIRITDVAQVETWARRTDGVHVMLESYRLDWTEFLNGAWGRFRNTCKNPPSRENPDLLTMATNDNNFRTLLFEGDRIDAAGKRDTGIDTSWFNLGCAGSALAKMALTGHTEAARITRSFATTLAERQTILKMFAADYCGTGQPFTIGGQPLDWRDDRGTLKLPAGPPPLVREARWTPGGAACLDKPRLDAHWTQAGFDAFGSDVYDQVMAVCPQLPACADTTLDTDGYHLLTATPPLAPPP